MRIEGDFIATIGRVPESDNYIIQLLWHRPAYEGVGMVVAVCDRNQYEDWNRAIWYWNRGTIPPGELKSQIASLRKGAANLLPQIFEKRMHL